MARSFLRRVCAYAYLSSGPSHGISVERSAALSANMIITRNASTSSSSSSSLKPLPSIGKHTAKWMQKLDRKSPMEYISEVPPIPVEGRVVACIGGPDPALGHPVEFICLDSDEPNVCKYCGLRYEQAHHH